VVEDHPLFRKGVVALLDAVDDVEVAGTAGSGEEAVALAARLRPDLVLMDLQLPGMSGIEATRAIVAADPAVKVLVLSLFEDDDSVFLALRAGARGYVLKDAPASEIIAAIEAVAGGGTFLSPAVSRRLFRNQAPRPLLSSRESEILSALARGLSSKQIAREMDVSVRTVEAHRQSIKRKLDLAGQAELIKYAVEHAGQ
jgi:DNA-binding NarL/FixJ family response regulator